MISAIVLAAGRSARMGKNKLVLPLSGEPALQLVLGALKGSKVDETVVVLGGGEAEVRRKVDLKGTKVVVNRRYADGMSTSIKAGLARVGRSTEAAIIVLGDQPFLSATLVDVMIDAFRTKRAPVVVPVHLGRRGNPILFARSTFPEIMKIEGDRGARQVVESYGGRVLEVTTADTGVLFDVDTPNDYRQAVRRVGRARRRRSRART